MLSGALQNSTNYLADAGQEDAKSPSSVINKGPSGESNNNATNQTYGNVGRNKRGGELKIFLVCWHDTQ